MTPDELAQVITPELLRESAQKFQKQLLTMPFQVLQDQTAKFITVLPGVRNQITFGELDGDAQLAPWSKNNRAEAEYTIKGRTLVVYPGNCAKDFDPMPLLHSIYGESLAQGDQISKGDVARKLVSLFAAKIGKHINDVVFVGGVRNVEGHTTADLFDSFDTIILKEVTAEKIKASLGNYLKVGAIDATNATEKLKMIWRKCDKMLRGLGKVYMYLPPEVYEAYCDDYQARHGALPYNQSFEHTYLEGSRNRCEFAVLDNMAGSDYIKVSIKQNFLLGTDIFGQENHVNIGKYAPWVCTFEYASIYGEQIRTLSKEVLMVADMSQEPDPEPSPVTLHTLTWKIGTTTFKTEQVAAGAAISAPSVPEISGKTFAWGQEIPSVMPDSDLTITGSYSDVLYTLTWKIGDDTFKTEQLAAGAAVSEPDPAPEAQEGKTFAWSDVPTNMPAQNTTVNGAYTDL